MLTEYIGMDIFLSHFKMLGKAETKSCRIKQRTGANDLILRKTRNLCEYISHDIHRVADNDVEGIRSLLHDLRSNAL